MLTLPGPFQTAVKEGKIGISQGYLLAANMDLDDRKLYEIFQSIMEKPVTYEELKKLLDAARQGKTVVPKPVFSGFYSNIKTVRTAFEKGKAGYTTQDMEKLVAELKAFCALVEEQVRKQSADSASAAAPASATATGKTAPKTTRAKK